MKAMDVGQRPESEIQQKNHVERAIIMAVHIPQELRIRSRGTERHSASN